MGRVCPPWIRSINILAAILPIDSTGTCIVVSVGCLLYTSQRRACAVGPAFYFILKGCLLYTSGEMPKAVLNLLAIARMKALAHRSYVTEIKQLGRDMRITLYEKAHIDPAGIPVLMQKYRRGLQFKAEQEPKFIYTPQGRPLEALTDFLTELNSLVEE